MYKLAKAYGLLSEADFNKVVLEADPLTDRISSVEIERVGVHL